MGLPDPGLVDRVRSRKEVGESPSFRMALPVGDRGAVHVGPVVEAHQRRPVEHRLDDELGPDGLEELARAVQAEVDGRGKVREVIPTDEQWHVLRLGPDDVPIVALSPPGNDDAIAWEHAVQRRLHFRSEED